MEPCGSGMWRRQGSVVSFVGIAVPSRASAPSATNPSLVLSASDDGTCRLWDLATGSLLKDYRIGGSPVTALLAAGAGDIAACVTEEGTLARIDLSAMAATEPARVHIALSQRGDQIFVGAGRHRAAQPIDGGAGAAAAKPDSFGETLGVAMNWTADYYISLHEGGAVLYWSLDGKTHRRIPCASGYERDRGQPRRLTALDRHERRPPSGMAAALLHPRPHNSQQVQTVEASPRRTPVGAGHTRGADADPRVRLRHVRTLRRGGGRRRHASNLGSEDAGHVVAIRAHDRDVLDCDIAPMTARLRCRRRLTAR